MYYWFDSQGDYCWDETGEMEPKNSTVVVTFFSTGKTIYGGNVDGLKLDTGFIKYLSNQINHHHIAGRIDLICKVQYDKYELELFSEAFWNAYEAFKRGVYA
jgi:ABC-type uncharacterized transport system ATPase subunit